MAKVKCKNRDAGAAAAAAPILDWIEQTAFDEFQASCVWCYPCAAPRSPPSPHPPQSPPSPHLTVTD